MDARQQRDYCLNVISTSPACYLATVDEKGFPEIRAMLNLRNPNVFPELRKFFSRKADDFTVYLSTNTSSMKIKQIRNNPKVSLYYCNPDDWQGVMLCGVLEIVEDPAIKKDLWQSNWNMYYPQGLTDPDFSIARLRPQIVKAYGNLSTFTINPEAA